MAPIELIIDAHPTPHGVKFVQGVTWPATARVFPQANMRGPSKDPGYEVAAGGGRRKLLR